MPRRRLFVALVPPDPLRSQLRALRELLGRTDHERVPPHLTLVPPVNLAASTVGDALRTVREAAVAASPFDLVLGPAASFAPRNPTVHLAADAPAELLRLRRRLRRGPLDRPDQHDFVPHVTLLHRGVDAQPVEAARVLPGTLRPWRVDRLGVFEQERDARETRWRLLAEEPFGPPAVVGRGGIEVMLRTMLLVDALASDAAQHGPALRVVAELRDDPEPAGHAVGQVAGELAQLDRLEVVEARRGMGVARHLLARWCSEVASAGASVVVVDADPDVAPVLGMLRAAGFVDAAGLLVRRLGAGAAGSVVHPSRSGWGGVVGS